MALCLTLAFCWHQGRLPGVTAELRALPAGHRQPVCLQGTDQRGGALQRSSEPAPLPERQVWKGFHRLLTLAKLSLVCHRLGRKVPTSSAATHRLVMHPLWVCISCSVEVFEKHWGCVRHRRKQVTTIATYDGFLCIPRA